MKNTVYHDIEVNGELNIAGGGGERLVKICKLSSSS